MSEYFAKHTVRNTLPHLSTGLGIYLLVSTAWHRSIVTLVLGIVFLIAGIAGYICAQFAKQ